jgi:hypothetical protein
MGPSMKVSGAPTRAHPVGDSNPCGISTSASNLRFALSPTNQVRPFVLENGVAFANGVPRPAKSGASRLARGPRGFNGQHECAQLAQILDLFAEDSWRRVYAGELEVRPPGAPTTEPALWD